MKDKELELYQLPDYILSSDRVLMRPPLLSDWVEWRRVRGANKNFLTPFEGVWPESCLSGEFYKMRLRHQVEEWKAEQKNFFLIFKKDEDGVMHGSDGARELIGGMNINDITRGIAQFASLGYWISQDYEGQGYMSEALHLTIKYCFEFVKLHRIHASCLLHNERSRKLLLRFGFKEEGLAEKYLQVNGRWQDHVLFGLPIENWHGG